MIQINNRGGHTSQNLIDNLLSFNVDSTWSAVGTGNATVINTDYFDGSGCLKINNTSYQTADLVVNNTAQSTIIDIDGVYDLSLYLKKDLAEDVTVNVEVFKNASSVYSTDFVFSENNVDNWTSFITSENFNLVEGDEITLRFTLKQNASSLEKDVNLYIDGIHLYNKERNQAYAPIYSQSTNKPNNTDTGGAHYIDGTYTSASPLVITEGTTVKLTCDNANSINNNIPIDFINGLFDSLSNKLLGVNEKDWFDLEIRFKATNSENNGYFDVYLDIGGSVGTLSKETQIFSRLSGTEQSFKANFDYYSGNTFISNGCDIFIEATKGDLSIYDIELLPFRKHKGY